MSTERFAGEDGEIRVTVASDERIGSGVDEQGPGALHRCYQTWALM